MHRAVIHKAGVALLLLAGCGERAVPEQKAHTPDLVRPDARADSGRVAVAIGEAGSAFRACQGAGTPRGAAGASLPVRAGPFETAAVQGSIQPAARFFVCTRSIDQRWMGVVYADDGTLSPACGVSAPAPTRNYAGPCRSGWVMSASVRSVAS